MSPKNWIKDARLAKGMSQQVAADAVGVDIRTWRRWELGEYLPPKTSETAIKKALSIPI